MKWLIVVLMVMTIVSIAVAINFSPSKIPFPYDQNQIIGKHLGGIQIEAEDFMIVDINCVDPQNDPFVITITSSPPGVYIINNDGNWRFQWTPDASQIGTWYVVLEATDYPPLPRKSKSNEGTIVIQVMSVNDAPIFYPLEDTVIVSHIWPQDYQKHWQELKKQRTIMIGPVQILMNWQING